MFGRLVMLAITALVSSLGAASAEDTREAQARRLFVEAARVAREPPCGAMSGVASFFVGLLDAADAKKHLQCLDHLERAAAMHDRLLTEFPETEAAFHVAKTPSLSRADLATSRAKLQQRIAELEKPPPVPAPKPQPAPPDRFHSILKDLTRQKAALEKSEPRNGEEDQVDAVPPEPEGNRAADRAHLASLVKQQVTPCWNIPGGAKDARKMQIAVRIQINPDGTLRGPPRIEDAARMSSDPFYRALAESAERALRMPSCTPLRLPYAQYDLWKDITLIFDPSEALGP